MFSPALLSCFAHNMIQNSHHLCSAVLFCTSFSQHAYLTIMPDKTPASHPTGLFSAKADTPAVRMVWSVSALCTAVADALEARFNPVTLRGELASFSRAASGHCYFTIADEQSQLKGAMFRRAASLLDFRPQPGDTVEIRGRLSVYNARGDLQIIAESMRETGTGNLYEQFMRLKAELQAKGLFDSERKRPLPAHPSVTGAVTSLSAAALHDICATFSRRAPHIPLIISPASVQGKHAPQEIIAALEALYTQSDLSVILLVRGGGSAEDLWAFNHPLLAHCIARSPVPVITGIGHETDFTIADFCADHRAATPTAAAETATADRQQQLHSLRQHQRRLHTALSRNLERQQQRLDGIAGSLRHPAHSLQTQQQHLRHLAHALQTSLQQLLTVQQHRLQSLEQRLRSIPHAAIAQQRSSLSSLENCLSLLNPMQVVGRGYAIVRNSSGNAITDVRQTAAGEDLTLSLKGGSIAAQVQSVRAVDSNSSKSQ